MLFGSAPFGDLPFGDAPDAPVGILRDQPEGTEFVYAAVIYASTSTIYVATREFATGATDIPASTPFAGVLSDYSLKRSIVGQGGFGEGFAVSDGRLSFDNTDGAYDYLKVDGEAVDARRIVVKKLRVRGGVFDRFSDGFLLYDGTASGWVIGFDSVEVALRDNSYLLEVPAQPNLYAGTGGAEGGDNLKGKPKPKLLGHLAWYYSPPLVDEALLIYQINDGYATTVGTTFDRGVLLSLGGLYANYAALAAGTVAPGTFDRLIAADGSFIRLGAAPDGFITVTGLITGLAGAVQASTIARNLIAEVTSIVDPDDLDVASFDTVSDSVLMGSGYYISEDERPMVSDVVADLLSPVGGWIGTRRDGRLYVDIMELPAAADAIFTAEDVIALRPERLPSGLSPPPWRISVNHSKSYTVTTDVAGAATDAVRAFVAQEWRTVVAEDASILTLHPLSQEPPPVLAHFTFDAANAAEDEADRRLALYGEERPYYRITYHAREALYLDVGRVVNQTYPRAELTAGRLMTVVEMTETMTRSGQDAVDQVEVLVYG